MLDKIKLFIIKNCNNIQKNTFIPRTMKAVNVFYDPQENSYFKIDKQTGESKKSHKNGQDFVRFKADYTGSDYRARKQNQKNLSPSYLSKPSFQPQYPHKHTVPLDNLATIRRQTKSHASISASPLYEGQMTLAGYESRIMEMESRAAGGDGAFGERLKEFTKIKEDLRKENHSPRKGYQGSIQVQKAKQKEKAALEFKNQLAKGATQSSILKRIPTHPSSQPQSNNPKNRTIETSSTLILKDQLLKQRQIFFRFNSNLRPQENQRQEKELRDRKTNLKILESLFIAKNNKQTSIVYQHQ